MTLPPIELPKTAFYKPRARYRAELLLDALQKVPGWKVVALTTKDISTTKGNVQDWGIMGLGSCPGHACVVSTYRLNGSEVRLAKVVAHELGHTLGVPHCETPKCLMNDAKGKADTVDRSQWFCASCAGKSHGIIKEGKTF